MSNPGRPLSPHMSIYRWPMTMILSILHRMTGVALTVGLIVYVAWIMAAAGGAAQYGQFYDLMQTPVGRLVLIAWTFAFFFHLCNGIRHLVWDTGRGFDRNRADASAWAVVVATVALTLCFWWLL